MFKKNGSAQSRSFYKKEDKMKKIYKISSALLVCLLLMSFFAACKEKGEDTDIEQDSFTGMPEYDAENISAYIEPFTYTGLTVEADDVEQGVKKLLEQITASAEIIEYPEAQVAYYTEQERAKYRYFSKRDGIEYEELLEALGVTEASMVQTAREYVKKDLVLEYIAKDANIFLTEAEKEAHADRYAERLVSVYGKDKEYIKANMQKQLYDTMESDKIMEYLRVNNTVNTAQ